jgi:hypothetical protein
MQEEKAIKNDIVDNKIRMELLPPTSLKRIAQVFTYGAKKYASWNYTKGLEYSRLYGALQRHMTAWYEGEERDPETGFSHLDHAGCCIMMLIEMQQYKPAMDDRPTHCSKKTMSDLIVPPHIRLHNPNANIY